MALETILIGLGGQLAGKLIAKKFGPEMGELADTVLGELGRAFGAEPTEAAIEKAIEVTPDKVVVEKVAAVEARAADLLLAEAETMRQGNAQQAQTIALLQEGMKQPGWRSDWLYAWQWFLMAAWAWTIFLVHILNAILRLATGATADVAVSLPAPDLGILVTLTGLYLALHMGGHTVLELVRAKWGGLFDRKDEAAK